MNKPRIAILSMYYHPEMGAPQARLRETASGLRARGWDVCVVTTLPNYPTGKLFAGYAGHVMVEDVHEGSPIFRIRSYVSNARSALPRIASMVSFSLTCLLSYSWLRERQPDIVFVESPPLPLCLSAIFFSSMLHAKVVVNVSDLWPLSALYLGVLHRGGLYRLLETVERFIYRSADLCTGQSREICQHIGEVGGARVALYRNGVDTVKFSPLDSPIRTPLRFVYAGLLGVAQGWKDLCSNLKFAPGVCELHLYGHGAECADVEEYIHTHSDAGIAYHGVVRHEDVPTIIASHDVAIIPLCARLFGAVPSKLYEAMSCGLPVLFIGEGDGAQIVRDHGIGWTVPPGKYEEINKRLAAICEMSQLELKHIGSRSRTAAVEHFDRQGQLHALDLELRSLLD